MAAHICSGDRVGGMVCSCHLDRCRECGAIRAIKKCPDHQAKYPHEGDSRAYFQKNAGFIDGIPMNDLVVGELRAFLEKVEVQLPSSGLALEVGAGVGRYAPMILHSGMTYSAVEPSPWAAEYIRHAYCADVFEGAFDDLKTGDCSFSLVLSAHCLEHLANPAEALAKMYRIMEHGGMLILVVPDDSDLYNADHLWFFTEPAIRRFVEDAGFTSILTRVEQIVNTEKFIYLVARKKRNVEK